MSNWLQDLQDIDSFFTCARLSQPIGFPFPEAAGVVDRLLREHQSSVAMDAAGDVVTVRRTGRRHSLAKLQIDLSAVFK